jgi:flagellar biosynthesis regulator FlaF
MTKQNIVMYGTAAVGLILAAVALGAFTLSFDVLRKEAIGNGVNAQLAFLVPLIIDGGLIAVSFFIVVNSIAGRKWLAMTGYGVMLSFVVLSVILNRFHAVEGSQLSIVYMVAPPIILAITTFIFDRMIESAFNDYEQADKLQTAYRSLVESNKQTIDTLRQLEAAYTQLKESYTELASYRPLMQVINPDVMLALQARAGLISMDEFVAQQSRYTRRNQAEDFFARVTVDMEAVEVE